MKNKKFLLLVGILILFLNSCLLEEKNLFPDSASQRIDDFIKGTWDALISAENGWSLEYFPRTDSKGIVFIMKFLNTDEVKIAYRNASGDFRLDACHFEVIGSNGPLLTFNLSGDRAEVGSFHWYSSPQKDGKGEEGDYEFNVIEYNNDVIKLKGKKRGTYCYMRKLPVDREWTEHYTLIDNMNNYLFNSVVVPVLRLNNEILLTLKAPLSHSFRAVPANGDDIMDVFDIPFILTDYGIHLNQPLNIQNQTVQTFDLNEMKNLLISRENENVWISDPNPADHIFNTAILYLAEKDSLGGKFYNMFEIMEPEFKANWSGNIELNRIGFGQFTTNKAIILRAGAANLVGLINIPLKNADSNHIQIDNFDSDNLNVDDKINPDMNNNAWLFYQTVNSIKSFLKILPGRYKVEFLEPFAGKNIKITSVDNEQDYLIITR